MQSPDPKTGMRRPLGDAGNQPPIRLAGIRLSGRAAVDGDRRGSCVLDHPGEQRGVNRFVIPAGPHFDSHRNSDGLGHRANDARRVLGLAHQAAPGIVFGNLRDRAAHVDVHDVGAHALDDLRGVGHLDRVAAKNLNGYWPLFLGVLGVLERAIDATHEAFGTHHFRHDEAAPAAPFDQPAECRIRHAGHGGQRDRIGEGEGTDLHRGRRAASPTSIASRARPASFRTPVADQAASTR